MMIPVHSSCSRVWISTPCFVECSNKGEFVVLSIYTGAAAFTLLHPAIERQVASRLPWIGRAILWRPPEPALRRLNVHELVAMLGAAVHDQEWRDAGLGHIHAAPEQRGAVSWREDVRGVLRRPRSGALFHARVA